MNDELKALASVVLTCHLRTQERLAFESFDRKNPELADGKDPVLKMALRSLAAREATEDLNSVLKNYPKSDLVKDLVAAVQSSVSDVTEIARLGEKAKAGPLSAEENKRMAELLKAAGVTSQQPIEEQLAKVIELFPKKE